MKYYDGNLTQFFKENFAIIGSRDSGKTTILEKVLSLAYSLNYTIILFDSATDHERKSLLVKTSLKYPNTLRICSPEKKDIHFDSIPENAFPFSIIKESTNQKIFLFDVSKYLEEGYETENLEERRKIREFYKRLVLQELCVMIQFIKNNKCIILMDEIELIPQMEDIFTQYKKLSIPIILALHEKVSLSSLSSFFKKIEL